MDKIIPAFQTTLFDPTLSDACKELAELGIDSLLDDGLFKSIPIVSILVGVKKTAENIHDRNLLKQTAKFIDTFNEKSISPSKLQKYKEKLNANPKFAEEELGRVMIILNGNVDLKKSEILGRLFRAYVEEHIDWDKFCELSEVISRIFISDIALLYDIRNKRITDTSQCHNYQAERLIALGLINTAVKSVVIGNLSGTNTQRYVQINEFGELFCRLSENDH